MAMIKIKVSEATDLQLDWLVARAEDIAAGPFVNEATHETRIYLLGDIGRKPSAYCPTTDPAQGQPLIEREKIDTKWTGEEWIAGKLVGWFFGPTMLIAAMRCHIASRLGEVVEVPDELA